ncbi:MAG: hypothetical protein JXQ90_02665, partial [Cyclobacteriaceae bacterium]
NDASGNVLTIHLGYSEKLSRSDTSDLVFNQNTTGVLNLQSISFSSDSSVLYSYVVSDSVDQSWFDFDIVDGLDSASNDLLDSLIADSIYIDTKNPTISNIVLSADTINDASGNVLTIHLGYSEKLSRSDTSDLVFNQDTTGVLNLQSISFSSDSSVLYSYVVSDSIDQSWFDFDIVGGLDSASNALLDSLIADSIYIDTRNPAISSLTFNIDTISDSDVSSQFIITAVYTEKMDRTINPIIEFQQEDTAGLIFNSSLWIDESTHAFHYDLIDRDTTIWDIDVKVKSARDTVGNIQLVFDSLDAFNIDTKNPEVSQIIVSIDTLDDANAGGAFLITTIFDEHMDRSIYPQVSFPNEDTTGLDSLSSIWVDEMTYRTIYNFTDADTSIWDIDVRVSGGQDSIGNIQIIGDSTDAFNIDSENPIVIEIEVSHDTISDSDEANQFIVSVTYSEPMDRSVSPTISYPFGESPLAGTPSLISASGRWSSNRNYILTYEIEDADTTIWDIDINISAAKDSTGNVQIQKDSLDLFSIDTQNPIVTIVIDNDTKYVKDGDSLRLNISFSEQGGVLGAIPSIQIDSDVNAALTSTSDPLVWTFDWIVGKIVSNKNDTATYGITAIDKIGNSAIISSSPITIVDNTVPRVQVVTNQTDKYLKDGDTVSMELIIEDLNGVTTTLITLSNMGISDSALSKSESGWQFDWTVGSVISDFDGSMLIGVLATDSAGNRSLVTNGDSAFVVDNTSPQLSIGMPSEDTTIFGPVSYLIDFYDDNGIDQSRINFSQTELVTTQSVSGEWVTMGNGEQRTIVLSDIEGVGYVGLLVPTGVVYDSAGNANSISILSDSVLVRKILTVSADNKMITYGDDIPELTYSYDGFYGNDDETVLSSLPVLQTDLNKYDCPTEPGEIKFAVTGNDDYYILQGVIGQISVNKVDLIATAIDMTMLYGDPVPELNVDYSDNFINGEGFADLDTLPVPSTIADSTSNVGNYAINFEGSAQGFDACYQIVTIAGQLSISPAPLEIVVQDKDEVFTTEPDTISFEIQSSSESPFRNNDDFDDVKGVPAFSLTSLDQDAGYLYDVNASGLTALNYDITYNSGTLVLYDPTAITSQPTSIEICGSERIEFSVVGRGEYDVRYQWEYRSDPNEEFRPITSDLFEGLQDSTLSADSVLEAWNNYEFRALVGSDFGQDVFSDVVSVTLKKTPPAVFAEIKGTNLLVTDYYNEEATYQWYKDGSVINGATEQFYSSDIVLDTTADYEIEICQDGCCRKSFVGQLALERDAVDTSSLKSPSIVIAPNPSDGRFSVTWNHTYQGPVELILVDMFGDVIKTSSDIKSESDLRWDVNLNEDLPDFTSGIYFVLFSFEDKVLGKKLFIRR